MARPCEICYDYTEPRQAKCGHKTYICQVCAKECSDALKKCASCENKLKQKNMRVKRV